ncbi:AraC family transcriptional regulator [Poseidonibacter ostreae]|jgi:AraC-like DNA-binding protein|uniref:Helix-turn-helix domain-containing protein n=1 Tax=Poseidonibacter ostreae TaxID=2654171 RepID=A0A6L4WV61_9BACT|nr:AraC family transcriptional regulator [Poseidonibacter ostreae]KAB7886503.1 helix-turn-helix domain-containing protein [Poseidonibacter ostreae]KAB7890648.1 helix-turn-helix domain-containing protein [Poseidonibacter ostreae]KAB7892369.1 helix-turn-helix domain-containing protein [Poseidonibacter ostreae]
MHKTFTKVFIDESLPFLELRYSNSNAHYKRHFHDTFSIGVNKEGRSIYENSTKSYTLDKNMLSIINPLEVHSCNSCSDVLNIYYMLYLDTKWCMNIQKLINCEIKEFVKIPIHILEDESFYKDFISLCEFIFHDNSILEKEDELIKFFLNFFSLYLENKEVELVDARFQEILLYLDENYKENISLDELSNKFELNSFYIIRLFKSQMNLTPHSYLLNVRINKAKEYLKNGYSIIDTALECGFFDQSHFHKNFLKIVAITPKEYKVNFIQ